MIGISSAPFYYAPGFLIWHSQDLMNWEPLCRVLRLYKVPFLGYGVGGFRCLFPYPATSLLICSGVQNRWASFWQK